MLIVIDPGHGGKDPGAVAMGVTEKAITWDLAQRIKKKLTGYKAQVEIFQPSAINPNSTAQDELYKPPQYAIDVKADYFLSLHINAGKGQGFETFVYKENSKADVHRKVIHKQVMDFLDNYNIHDRGQKFGNLYVLRKTSEAGIPSVLIECLFIDNERERKLLQNETFLNNL
ncbi:MAG: N-acetylmuramoyl-L-alanine amidase, partial [Peptococcaceae bacterium]|nr:N-acetylmuramoyl-L-alanine amidase [Peptococcaceae bacterium]